MLRHLHLHRWTLIPHAIHIHVSLLLLFLARLWVSILHVRCRCIIRGLEYWILLLEHVAMAVSVWISYKLRFSSLSAFHLLILILIHLLRHLTIVKLAIITRLYITTWNWASVKIIISMTPLLLEWSIRLILLALWPHSIIGLHTLLIVHLQNQLKCLSNSYT